MIDKDGKETNEKDLLAALSLDSSSIRDASAGLELLNEWDSSVKARDSYKKKAAERWSRASVFQVKHIDSI